VERVWNLERRRDDQFFIAESEIHLWQLDDIEAGWSSQSMLDGLSLDEQEKADLFGCPLSRNRYIQCRLWLRGVLAGYLGCERSEVPLVYSDGGKPFLSESKLDFTLSHSGNRALLGVSLEHELGVDIEKIAPVPEAALISGRWFSAEEHLSISLANDADMAFLQCWVRHEAVHKAIGQGLALPMDSIKIPCVQNEMGTVFHGGRKIQVQNVQVKGPYVAAIAWFHKDSQK